MLSARACSRILEMRICVFIVFIILLTKNLSKNELINGLAENYNDSVSSQENFKYIIAFFKAFISPWLRLLVAGLPLGSLCRLFLSLTTSSDCNSLYINSMKIRKTPGAAKGNPGAICSGYVLTTKFSRAS